MFRVGHDGFHDPERWAVKLGPQWLGANKTLTLRAFEGARYIFGYRFQREAVSTAPI